MFMNGGRDMIIWAHRKSFNIFQYIARFLWRENANIAISRHYKRYDVFVEAEANKNAGKFDNASIDYQIDFYRREENLTAYNESKLPITSGRFHAFMFAWITLKIFIHVHILFLQLYMFLQMFLKVVSL